MPVNSFANYYMSWRPKRNLLKRPIYLSLAKLLEEDIRKGHLQPGTKLPPQRELADFLDINFTTVTRTYKLCELKGLIYTKAGSGTFISPHAVQSITISTDYSMYCINLSFVASFEQSNYLIQEIAHDITKRNYFPQLLDYNDPSGMPHQKTVGLNWLKEFGIHADKEHIAIVSGALNGVSLALLSFFQPGERIAVDYYTFSNFIELAKMYHLQLVPIAGDTEGMFPNELDAQCRLNDIRGIYIMPTCANPTTITISKDRRNALANIIKKHKLILIEDDMYAFLTKDDVNIKEPISHYIPEQSIYICSTSKAICSGIRIAYIVFGNSLKEQLLRALYNVNVKTSSLNAEIVTELLNTGKVYEIIAQKKELAKKANAYFDNYFPQADYSGHPLSFFRWLPIKQCKIQKNIDGNELESLFQKSGIQVFHSRRFLSGAPQQNQYLRVALSTTKTLDELACGLKILKTCLQNL